LINANRHRRNGTGRQSQETSDFTGQFCECNSSPTHARQRGRRFPNDAFYSTCKKINRHKTARKDWHFIPIHDWQFNELNFCPPLFLAREMARSISPRSIQDSNVSAFSKH
jgi:hypothetical protein